MMSADMHELGRRRALHGPETASQRTHIITADSHVKAEGREYIFTFLGAFAKLRKVTVSFVMSVGRTTRLPLDGISRSFVCEYFLENLLIKLKFD
jgi:hypothetical protein